MKDFKQEIVPCKNCGRLKEINNPTQYYRYYNNPNMKCKHCRSITHGNCTGDYSKTYMIWGSMLQRVTNPKNKRFSSYGGRGITVDPRWLDYENFLEDMGEKPEGLSLDRKDNDGNYCKSNCRWATDKVQNNNRRVRKQDTYQPKILTKKQYKKILKMLSKGKLQKQIVKKVGVSQTIVSKVKRGVYYAKA